MQPMWVNAAALTVVTIYFIWRTLVQVRRFRGTRGVLRERVAYMLWVAAERVPEPASHGLRD